MSTSVLRRFVGAATAMAVLVPLLAACASAGGQPGFGGAPAATSAIPAGQGGTDSASASLRLVDNLPPPQSGTGASGQVIFPSDVIEIDVFQVNDLDRTAQVDSNGTISLPLIGTVPAAGRTLLELQTDITRRYSARYLQNPQITVSMKESAGQRVTLDGEFNRAGIYPTTANMSLLQAVALAGNFSRIGDPDKVYVYRQYGTQQLVAQYSVDQIRQGRRADPKIYGGDVIVAFPSGMKVLQSSLSDALGIARSATGLGGLL